MNNMVKCKFTLDIHENAKTWKTVISLEFCTSSKLAHYGNISVFTKDIDFVFALITLVILYIICFDSLIDLFLTYAQNIWFYGLISKIDKCIIIFIPTPDFPHFDYM